MQIPQAIINIGYRRDWQTVANRILIVALRRNRLCRAIRKSQGQGRIRRTVDFRTGTGNTCTRLVANLRNRRNGGVHIALIADHRRRLRTHAAHRVLDPNARRRTLRVDAAAIIGIPADDVVT